MAQDTQQTTQQQVQQAAEQAKAKAEAAADNAKKTAEQVKSNVKKSKEKINKLRETNTAEFTSPKVSIDPKAATALIISIILPILLRFINTEKIANSIINKLIRDTKLKLKDKGRLDVIGSSLIFVPKDKQNYQRFKDQFDRRVDTLKQIIKTLKTIIDTLIIVLRVARAALAAYRVYLELAKKKKKTKAVSASVNLQSPSGPYPAAADYIISQEVISSQEEILKEKIEKYILIIDFTLKILPVLQRLLNTLKIKLDQLSFTIQTTPDIPADLVDSASSLTKDEGTDDYDNNQYTIKVITLPSGALQAVAYDKFSGLKITNTSPSKTRKADELINELKQILGQ